MEEIWKPIKGAVKGHEVSSLGRVRNRKGRLLKTPSYGHGTKDWYAHLNLNINGTSKTFYVHRLVAEAFLQNKENKPDINHKNGVKSDNRVENLEWVTESENTRHSWANGFHEKLRHVLRNRKGYKSPVAKPVMCVETNVVYSSALEAQKQLGIAQSSICAVCKGKQKTKGKYTFTPKTAGGYHWRYA